MNSVRSNNITLKYKMFSPSGCSYIGFRKFDFVAKTRLLSAFKLEQNCLSIEYLCLFKDIMETEVE